MHSHLYQIFGIIVVSFACGQAWSWMVTHKNVPGDDSGHKQSWAEDCNQKIESSSVQRWLKMQGQEDGGV